MSRNPITSRLLRTITVQVLIAGILLQPLLSYLVTPFVEQGDHGQLMVMCTLKGLEQAAVDNPVRPGATGDEESCPALKLFQLSGSARVHTPEYTTAATFYLVELVNDRSTHQYHTLQTSEYSTRAPPMS